MNIGDKYGPAMEIETQEEADAYLEKLVLMVAPGTPREEAIKIEKSNLGYYAGYYDYNVRERVERLFRCKHPVFGAIAENGPPSLKQAYEAGLNLAKGRS